jgi:hypothetical protein
MYGTADRRAYGVALDGRFGQAYNEEAFRYFLQLERKRAARARRPVLLLLLDLREPSQRVPIDPALASKLFDCLCGCLRETDVVGWYREDRVAAAVLTQVDGVGLPPEATAVIRQRVGSALRECLSADVARNLRVRVYQLRPVPKG